MPTKKKEMNKKAMEEILSHLDEAMRLCKRLDLSQIPSMHKIEWENRMKICKDAIQYTRGSVQGLLKILE